MPHSPRQYPLHNAQPLSSPSHFIFRWMCTMVRFFAAYCSLRVHVDLLSGLVAFLAVLQLKELEHDTMAVDF